LRLPDIEQPLAAVRTAHDLTHSSSLVWGHYLSYL
jgi:hypothetical protein